jgi:HNH endonuclease
MQPTPYPSCIVVKCSRRATARGYCKTHYSRLQRRGDPLAERRTYKNIVCIVDDCADPAYCRTMCIKHYARVRKHGSPHITWPKVAPNGTRVIDKSGYARVKMKGHPNANPGGWVLEHVYVLSEVLGRGLLSGESVHHKDGQRLNNAPDNLELWVSNQPPGQRVSDVLTWAREIIARYDSGETAPATTGR